MATPTYEIVNKILFVTGSLDRAADAEFQQALDRYAKAVVSEERVVDMSNVHWLTPSGAKVLIQAGQETNEKGVKMRVLASRCVMQTLNLLGAKTWLQIESCLTPNDRPTAPAAPAPANTGAADQPAAQASAPAAAVTESAVFRPGVVGLADSMEVLTGGACLLRVISANRRYNFGLNSGEQIMGVLKERLGGSWVMVEAHGSRKMLNLDLVQYCEPL